MNIVQKMLVGVWLAVASSALPASADTLSVTFRNSYWDTVQLKFYSEDYDWVWPSADDAYELSPDSQYTIDLNCEQGERIVYGAWVKGDSEVNWGAYDGTVSCEHCVFICNIDYDIQNLVDNPEMFGD